MSYELKTVLTPISATWSEAQQRWTFGNGPSYDLQFAPDGSAVAYTSEATNLATFDTDQAPDILLRQLGAQRTKALLPSAANGEHSHPLFAGSPSALVFRSTSTNLPGASSDALADLFRADWQFNAAGEVSNLVITKFTEGADATPLGVDGARVLFASTLAATAAPLRYALSVSDGSSTLRLATADQPIAAARFMPDGTVAFETAAALIDVDRDGVGDIGGADSNSKADVFVLQPGLAPTVTLLTADISGSALTLSRGSRLNDGLGSTLAISTDITIGQDTSDVLPQPRVLVVAVDGTAAASTLEQGSRNASLGNSGVAYEVANAVYLQPAGGNPVLLSIADEAGGLRANAVNGNPTVAPVPLRAEQVGVGTDQILLPSPAAAFETTASNLHFAVPSEQPDGARQLVLAARGLPTGAEVIVDYTPGSRLNPWDANGQQTVGRIDINVYDNSLREQKYLSDQVLYSGTLSARLGVPVRYDDNVALMAPAGEVRATLGWGNDVVVVNTGPGGGHYFDVPGLGDRLLPLAGLFGSVDGSEGHDTLLAPAGHYLAVDAHPLQLETLQFAPNAGLHDVSVVSVNVRYSQTIPFQVVVGSPGTDVLEILPRFAQLSTARDLDLSAVTVRHFGGAGSPDRFDVASWVGTVLAPLDVGTRVSAGVAADGSAGVRFRGSTQDDVFVAGNAADLFNAGPGVDTVDYRYSPHRVAVNLSAAAATSGGYAEGDSLLGVENIVGTDAPSGDYLKGSVAANSLHGRDGPDHLLGEAGDDQLFGDHGHDLLEGNAGDDRLHGGEGDDTAFVSGSRADFGLFDAAEGSGFEAQLVDLRFGGSEGTDSLAGIEFIRFDDGTFRLADLLAGPSPPTVSIDLAASRLLVDEGNPGGPGATWELVLRHAGDPALAPQVRFELKSDSAPGAQSASASDIGLPLGTPLLRGFSVGSNELRIAVPVQPDLAQEPSETLRFELTGISGGLPGSTTTAVLTVRDDDGDVVTLDSAASITSVVEGSVAGGGASLQLVLRRTGNPAQDLQVSYEIQPASSGSPLSAADLGVPLGQGSAVFAAGSNELIVRVPVQGDSFSEGPESARFAITGIARGALGSEVSTALTVLDDDPFQISLSGPAQAIEGTPVELRITSNEDPDGPYRVLDYRLSFGDGSEIRPPPGPVLSQGNAHYHSYADGVRSLGGLLRQAEVEANLFGGASSRAALTLSVLDAAPQLPFTGAAEAIVGLPWALNLGTYVDVPGDPLLGLEVFWDNGRGLLPITPQTPQIVSEVYTSAGPKSVRVYARNDDGSFEVGALNVMAVAEPGPAVANPGTGTEGRPLALPITPASRVTDLGLLQYTIEWGDGHVDRYSGADLAALPVPWSPTHVYADNLPQGQAYRFQVDMALGTYQRSTDGLVLIEDVPPAATVQLPTSAQRGQMVWLTLNDYVDPGNDQPASLLLETSTGSLLVPWPSNATSGSGRGISVPLSFDRIGRHEVTVKLVEADGHTTFLDTREIDISIQVTPPSGGTVSQWAAAWSDPFIALSHKADHTSTTEPWSPATLAAAGSTNLAGGDLFQSWLGVSGQSLRSSTVRQEIDGREALRITLDEPADRVIFTVERLFVGETGDNRVSESGRADFYLGPALVRTEIFSGTSSNGHLWREVDVGLPFDTLIFTAGAFEAAGFPNGVFHHGALADAAIGGARLPTATASVVGTGSEYLLSSLEFFFDDVPTVTPMGVADLPMP